MQHVRPVVNNGTHCCACIHIAMREDGSDQAGGSTWCLAYLMPSKKVLGDWAVICQDVHNLGVGQLMTGCDILAVHFGTNHMVADRSVHMVCKV